MSAAALTGLSEKKTFVRHHSFFIHPSRSKPTRGIQTDASRWFLFGEKGDPDGQCDLVKHTDCHSEQNGHPLGGRFAWESVSFEGKRIATPVCALARNDRLSAKRPFRGRPISLYGFGGIFSSYFS